MRSIMKNLFTSHMRNPTAEEDYIFYMQSIPGDGLKDSITGVPAVTSISGTRYGVVNGVVTQFDVNQPPIEDDGLRGCPAFTQYVTETENYNGTLWANVSGDTLSTPGGNRLVYGGGAINDYLIETYPSIPGGTASKIMMLVANVSASTYPQTFRLKNTQGGVKDNFSDDIILIKPEKLFFRVVNEPSTGTGVQSVGIIKSSDDSPFNINISLNLAEANFIYPYTPNDTTSFVSFVSEVATSSTGSSFDLDDTKLARLKDTLIGPNAQGHLDITVESNTDSSWWANSSVYNILSVNNTAASLLYVNKDSGGDVTFRTTDGTNIASVSQALTVGTTYKISVDWGTHSTGQKMRLTVNGVRSSLRDFSGAFGTQDLRFLFGNTVHAGWIVKDSLRIMDKPIW